ncbi:MAG: hypothetical protein FWF47_05290 [Clostridia bacterium]|nr:hypothetical protein [Clostridia bacterium]
MNTRTKANRRIAILLVMPVICGMLAFLPLTSSAASNEVELAAIINNFDPGNGGPAVGQLMAEANTANHTVTVLRGAAGARNSLELDIASGVTVIWKAEHYGWTYGGGLIGLSGEGTLEVAEGGTLINYGTDTAVAGHSAHSLIKVSGGILGAADGYAITTDDDSSVTISGGFVFAAGSGDAVLIPDGMPLVTDFGIVCGWKKSAWLVAYPEGTADDLTVIPADSAKWYRSGDLCGILYTNGLNVGFFPVSGISLYAKSDGDPAVFVPYKVKVTVDSLNIRKGPGKDTAITGTITDRGIYTIVDEADGPGAAKWGKLESGKGWISLDFTVKYQGGSSDLSGATQKPSSNPSAQPTQTPDPGATKRPVIMPGVEATKNPGTVISLQTPTPAPTKLLVEKNDMDKELQKP